MKSHYDRAMREFLAQGGLPVKNKKSKKPRKKALTTPEGGFWNIFMPGQKVKVLRQKKRKAKDGPCTPCRRKARENIDGETPSLPQKAVFELKPQVFEKWCDLAGPGESPEGFR